MYNEEKYYNLAAAERSEIIAVVRGLIASEEKIIFSYLHGSFFANQPFRDIDIAVYLTDLLPAHRLKYELKIEESIEQTVRYPVDLQVLNCAPPAFCYMVIKNGCQLAVKDDNLRVEFETYTLKRYFDLLPFREKYLQVCLAGRNYASRQLKNIGKKATIP
jgi:predicted nucleotidyltransferase